jgi:hypothetical protein
MPTRLVTPRHWNPIQFRQVLFKERLTSLEVPRQLLRLGGIELPQPKALNKSPLPLDH